MRYKVFFAFFAMFYFFPIFALPPFISIEERVEESPLIITGKIQIIKQRQLFHEIQHITLYVKRIRILKNTTNANIPEEFYLYLNIYPETFENKLKFIPEEQTYIIFLEPYLKDNEITIYKLYKEEPFALEPWTKEKEEKIYQYLKKKSN